MVCKYIVFTHSLCIKLIAFFFCHTKSCYIMNLPIRKISFFLTVSRYSLIHYQYVRHLYEQTRVVKASRMDLMQRATTVLTLWDVRRKKTLTLPILSTERLPFESSRVELFSLTTETPHRRVLNISFKKRFSSSKNSLTPSFHKLDEDIKKADSGAEDPSQSKSVLILPWFIRGAVQTCTLSAPQCQTVLNMLPVLITFFLPLKNSQLGSFEEHKMQQEEHQKHHSARLWDSQDEQGAELLSALRGQRGICLFGNPNFAKVHESHAASETFWT